MFECVLLDSFIGHLIEKCMGNGQWPPVIFGSACSTVLSAVVAVEQIDIYSSYVRTCVCVYTRRKRAT